MQITLTLTQKTLNRLQTINKQTGKKPELVVDDFIKRLNATAEAIALKMVETALVESDPELAALLNKKAAPRQITQPKRNPQSDNDIPSIGEKSGETFDLETDTTDDGTEQESETSAMARVAAEMGTDDFERAIIPTRAAPSKIIQAPTIFVKAASTDRVNTTDIDGDGMGPSRASISEGPAGEQEIMSLQTEGEISDMPLSLRHAGESASKESPLYNSPGKYTYSNDDVGRDSEAEFARGLGLDDR